MSLRRCQDQDPLDQAPNARPQLRFDNFGGSPTRERDNANEGPNEEVQRQEERPRRRECFNDQGENQILDIHSSVGWSVFPVVVVSFLRCSSLSNGAWPVREAAPVFFSPVFTVLRNAAAWTTDVKDGKRRAAALLRRSRAAATVSNSSSEASLQSSSSRSTATTRVLGDAATVMGGGSSSQGRRTVERL
nr:hypothetical protein Itr_chr14CG09250 [Ipomoea trifida]